MVLQVKIPPPPVPMWIVPSPSSFLIKGTVLEYIYIPVVCSLLGFEHDFGFLVQIKNKSKQKKKRKGKVTLIYGFTCTCNWESFFPCVSSCGCVQWGNFKQTSLALCKVSIRQTYVSPICSRNVEFVFKKKTKIGFLPWETRIAFSRERQMRQSRATQLIVHVGILFIYLFVYLVFPYSPNSDMDYSIFNVRIWSFACVYTRGLRFIVSSEGLFVGYRVCIEF